MNEKYLKIIRWIARIVALTILLIGLPLYFGYGNPLPFSNPENTIFDNAWLFAFLLMFIGLGLGWKWEKIGGYVVVIPIAIATIIGSIFSEEIGLPGSMFVSLIVGILYLIVGYKKINK
jgi:hypothetical protein